MRVINIEIKAKIKDPVKIRKILESLRAEFRGLDRQIDTYFNVLSGRLKLREGRIENSLIYYKRKNKKGPKESDILLYKTAPGGELKELLSSALGVKTVVDKERGIYFLKNVKFHIDKVKGLGSFAEIEAMGKKASEKKKLLRQCGFYMKLFGITGKDLLSGSYSDMV
ncbi:MAG: adenylate cyclase [Elusimicrobia bacterium CG08_land_8_20_14_0_20_51_18]|nr:MAG: adenylate cyclase [Elusimicrobia bacterium CG08_land_8_20_14_0_20_51_18]